MNLDVDVAYLAAMVAFWQSIFSLLLSIPLAPLSGTPINELPSYFYDGFKCMCGENTILEATVEKPADDCSMAPYMIGFLIVANSGFQFLITLILKYGTANLLRMASAIMVPTCNVAFSLPIMPRSIPMSPSDFIGLILVMTGLIVYRFINEVYRVLNSVMGFEYFEVQTEDGEDDEQNIEDSIDIRSIINTPVVYPLKLIGPHLIRRNSMPESRSTGVELPMMYTNDYDAVAVQDKKLSSTDGLPPRSPATSLQTSSPPGSSKKSTPSYLDRPRLKEKSTSLTGLVTDGRIRGNSRETIEDEVESALHSSR